MTINEVYLNKHAFVIHTEPVCVLKSVAGDLMRIFRHTHSEVPYVGSLKSAPEAGSVLTVSICTGTRPVTHRVWTHSSRADTRHSPPPGPRRPLRYRPEPWRCVSLRSARNVNARTSGSVRVPLTFCSPHGHAHRATRHAGRGIQ